MSSRVIFACLTFVQSLLALPHSWNLESKDAKLSNETKLSFYGLYKQITDGPCNTPAPSRFKMIERAKWQAWSSLGKYVASMHWLPVSEVSTAHA